MDTAKLVRASYLWERVKLGNVKRNFPSVACILIRRIKSCNIFVVLKNYGTYIEHLLSEH